MLDVFTEQHEVLIKDGIANLYWYRGDLQKAWLRVGVPAPVSTAIWKLKDDNDLPLSKRKCMDRLYQQLRKADFNIRVKISREFVRILVEHKNFVPQDSKHKIDVAERSALKLRELIAGQESELERKRRDRLQSAGEKTISYDQQLTSIRASFELAMTLTPQQKGYALEKLFTELMHISKIPVEAPFSLKGEQIDGAIKYDSNYYIVELKWQAGKAEPKDIGTFYFKVEGRMGARGIFIAMSGYSDGVIETLPRGKELRVLLLDGNHLANVIYGHYTFHQLLEHSIKHASLKGQLYCPHRIE